MRFGEQLRTSLIKDHYYHYIDYDHLKQVIQEKPFESARSSENPRPHRKWTEDDEKAFVAELESELEKVFTFQRVKSEEIIRRIRASEREVNEVISQLDRSLAGHQDHEGNPSEEDFLLLEEDLSNIIADVHDLAKFTQLNYTGFQKIIKKHDKQTTWHLKPVFATRLKAKPFFKYNYDESIVKLSKLYDVVRTRGKPIKGDSAAGGGQQNFVRQTTKYWHLPVLVFNASKEFEAKDSAISSIYYDNSETWELYMGRLKKTEGAEAIRLRWYGGMDTETIFVERKTHREDWTGESSVKARFSLKEKNVNAFLSGKMTVEQVFEKMRREKKKSEKEIGDLEQLAREIQYRVVTRKLVPVTRSFYNRTAFQLPGDARVRISLDTELTMTREDNLDGRQRAGKNWRRMDIGIDYPFSQLRPEDVERFPYAVLEVKLQTQAGQDPPEWVRGLISSHLVEAVPKFSKFIHGTATMFPTRIHLLPFWMPQMGVDIRKPVTAGVGIARPRHGGSYTTSDDTYDEDSDDEESESDQSSTIQGEETQSDGTNGAVDGGDQNTQRLQAAHDALAQHEEDRERDYGEDEPNALDAEERVAARPLEHNPDDYPLYDSEEEDDIGDTNAAHKAGGWHYGSETLHHHVVLLRSYLSTGLSKLIPTAHPNLVPGNSSFMPSATSNQVEAKRFKAPKGKRIHVPVRVEPKVQFATERTFLAWLEFSIILGGIAATLLNFGDNVSLASAWAFTILACVTLLYSLGLYIWRVRMIKGRRAVRYHDWLGPSVLCVGILGAVGVSFGVRLAGVGVEEG